ncbi:MAG TPA: ATP-binding protein, partial [Candidatus Latescibacteria bacterium]|nr:ATP-binding protein [Candidatus Latescibacterota bacterium]
RDTGQTLDYQCYRLAFRTVASSTNERTMIATVAPRLVYMGNSMSFVSFANDQTIIWLSAMLNAFTVDWLLRGKVSANCNMFYVYDLPIPRFTPSDPWFWPVVSRAARLICTTPEFDDLAREVGLAGHEDGATTPAERARLRAELDGIVAHIYGLTDEEFAHILRAFPLVPEATKTAALEAYRDVAAGRITPERY